MVDSAALERLEQVIGYKFQDQSLLKLALTHRSHSRRNNERLEFLGDAELNFLIARELYSRFARANEGELSRLRAQLVRGSTLAALAREFGISDCIVLGVGERKSGGDTRDSILADALEALIGAILIDSNELQCGEIVVSWFASRLGQVNPSQPPKDAKTRLQELLQGNGSPLPVYEIISVTGKAHARKFEVSCTATGLSHRSVGTGRSRRAAEQMAAENALGELTSRGNE